MDRSPQNSPQVTDLRTVKPFLKWAGGKRWLVAKHPEWFAFESRRHYEPFLGSAAVYFHVMPKTAVLADTNAELIATYQAVKDAPELVLKHLKVHSRRHSAKYYYAVRSLLPRTAATRAARFIYLNRTCFNGLYRVNMRGVFNVPKGTKSSVLLPTDDFDAVSRLLQSARLVQQDFSETIADASEGDFVYADPPYTVNHNTNNFVKYNERIFSWSDQVRLAESALLAARRGARVIVSNANHPSVRELYEGPTWVQLTASRFSVLASSSDFRKPSTELVISNYLDRSGAESKPRF